MIKYSLPVIQDLRAVKTAREIIYITQAQRISEVVLKEALGKIKKGVKEISIARFIIESFKHRGIKALAFEPIVSFGKNSSEIHHEPNGTKLKIGDFIMLDFGCTVNSYCSDMTRTYIFGKLTDRQKKVYLAVLESQERALKKLALNERKAIVIDASARRSLKRKFGLKAFRHGLGHGIGTVIHEWPNFKSNSSDILRPGMVMTVEPGAYFEGWGGVRIEDMALIKTKGIQNLTKAPKNLDSIVLRP